MNSAELAKRIINCLYDGYDDEECREKAETRMNFHRSVMIVI